LLKDNIFITGFMGTGKTTVADALARRTGKTLIDTDKLIETKEGKSIAEIFKTKGELYFRRIERQILTEIVNGKNVVVATGGGTLLDEESYQFALDNGIVIVLQARPNIILKRLQQENSRPLLAGENKLGRIIDLMNKRKDRYKRFKYCIDTSNLSVNQVVDKVIQICQRGNNANNTTEI